MNRIKHTLQTRLTYAVISKLIIFAAVALLAVANYQPGSTLMGWDNFLTELGPAAEVDRAWQASWQDFEGLGTMGGLMMGADLPRRLLINLATLVVPAITVRYLQHWIFMLLGAFGVYWFCKRFLLKTKSELGNEIGATVGALWYLLNLATIQTFFIPNDFFTAHFAMLPWLIGLALTYIKTGQRTTLFYFGLITVLGATQFVNPTMFFAFSLLLGLVIITQIRKSNWKRILSLVGVFLIVNSSWLLVFGRYFITNSGNVSQSTINQLASEPAFRNNQTWGTIDNIIQLKGFWFGNTDLTVGGEFTKLMSEWGPHTDLIIIKLLLYLMFMLTIVGIGLTFTRNRRLGVWLILGLLMGFVFLGAGNPPFGWLFDFLRNYVPFFAEALRFSFTKFSIIHGFIYSLGLSVAVATLAAAVTKVRISIKPIEYLVAFLPFMFGLVLISFPAFQGYYFSPNLRVKIPSSYQSLFDYMETQPVTERIAYLPIHTHWGWSYHNWGYQGSGFIWYGLRQPVLDRAFDVWSKENEQFYQELHQAYYAKNVTRIEQILDRYQVNWLLWDTSKFVPTGYQEAETLNFPALRELLLKSSRLKIDKQFGTELLLYKFQTNPAGPLVAVENPVAVGPAEQWKPQDGTLGIAGLNQANLKPAILTPFDHTLPIDGRLPFTVDETTEQLVYQFNQSDYPYQQVPLRYDLAYQLATSSTSLALHANLVDVTGQNIANALDSTLPLPVREYYLVVGSQVYGKYRPGNTYNQTLTTTKYTGNQRLPVRIYEEFELNKFNSTSQEFRFTNCNDQKKATIDQQELSGGRQRIYLGSTLGCAHLPLYKRALDGAGSLLVRVDFSYRSPTKPLLVCIRNANGCITELKRLAPSTESKNFSLPWEIGTIERDQGLYIAVDNSDAGNQDLANFEISLPVLTYHRLTFTRDEFVGSQAPEVNTADRVSLTTSGQITHKLIKRVQANLDDLGELDTSMGCYASGSATSFREENRQYIRFKVQDRNICMTTDLSSLNTSEAHLVAFDGLAISGRRPEVCILDIASNTCATLGQVRSANDKWIRNYWFIPAQSTNTGQGYKLIIYNWGIGLDVVEYGYDNLRVYQLASDRFYSTKLADSLNSLYQQSSYATLPFQRLSTTAYQTNLSQLSAKSSHLVLYQGYDPGWIVIGPQTNPLEFLGAILGQNWGSSQPQRFQGWANVWEISKIGKQNVTILYAPALLGYIGWAITLGSLGLLALAAINIRKRE